MTPAITCSLVEHWIYLLLDGELSDELNRELEQHLDGCAKCQERFDRALVEQRVLARGLDSLTGEMDHLLEGTLDERELEKVASGGEGGSFWKQARTPLGIAACLVMGVSASVLVWLVARDRGVETATLRWEEPGLVLRHGDGAFEALPARGVHALYSSESVRADDATGATLVFGAGETSVSLAGGSSFSTRLEEDTPVLVLEQGVATCETRPGSARFRVETPAAVVKVSGTHFHVHHDAERAQTLVDVLEGRVRVELRSRRAHVELAAGEMACAYRADILAPSWKRNEANGEWVASSAPRTRWLLRVIPRAGGAAEPVAGAASEPEPLAPVAPARVAPRGAEPAPPAGTPLDLPPRRFRDDDEGDPED